MNKNTRIIPLLETLLDVKEKNGKSFNDAQFMNILQYDPQLYTIDDVKDSTLVNQRESYSRWLIMLAKQKKLQSLESEKVRKALALFSTMKNRKGLLPSNDINYYKTFEELKDAIISAQDKLTSNQKDKDARRDEKKLNASTRKLGLYMDGAVELIFDGNDWEVWIPKTYEGTKALSRGASWCTAGSQCDTFNRYKEDGELYIIINKGDKSTKYQLSVVGRDNYEFKDANNESSVGFRRLIHSNPELLEFFMTLDDVTTAYTDLDDSNMAANDRTEEEIGEIAGEFDIMWDYENETAQMATSVLSEFISDFGYFTQREIEYGLDGEGIFDVGESDEIKDLLRKTLISEEFIDEIDWHSNQYVEELYDSLVTNDIDISKFDFVKALFNTENDSDDNIKKVQQILVSKSEFDNYEDLFNKIGEILQNYSYVLLQPISDDAYIQLKRQNTILNARYESTYTVDLTSDFDTLDDFIDSNFDIVGGDMGYADARQTLLRKYTNLPIALQNVWEPVDLNFYDFYSENGNEFINEVYGLFDLTDKDITETHLRDIEHIIKLGS